MNDESQEYGNLAPIETETPDNDPLIKELESAPEQFDEVDKHVWRRHLENVQDLMLEHHLDFVSNKQYARAEALARATIEISGETDSLTGIKNKNGLTRTIDDLLSITSRKNADRKIVFIRADANGLKQINDSKGHKAGDEFIRKIGETLKKQRRGDIVARDGGDEFAIVLLDTDLDGANEYWQRFCESLPTEIQIVAGAAMVDGTNIEDAKHQADLEMYKAKLESKDTSPNNTNFGKNILKLESKIT